MTSTEPTNLLADADATGAPEDAGCGGNCTCGHGSAASPVFDVRAIPPAIRHATIFGALGAVAAGESLVLVTPHEPLPLLAQLDEQQPGVWTASSHAAAPDEWRVRLTRAA
jgi:uncharacterized protein (DUF2249 family)